LSCEVFGFDPVPFGARPVKNIEKSVSLDKKFMFDLKGLQNEIEKNLEF
jgi:hypothetical protein